MKVVLIGKTQATLFPMPGKASGSNFEDRVRWDAWNANEEEGGQNLIEFAGRLCYESFDLPSSKTETNSGYIRNIIALGHESVLEHASVTLYVEGVSRNLSHELIRHRHLSFSELSQRYVSMDEARWVVPPLWRELSEDWADKRTDAVNENVRETYRYNVEQAEKRDGVTRKQAREAARAVLPGGVETKFVVSGNLRAWRDVLKKRYSAAADKEMQIFAGQVLEILSEEYLDVFADIQYEE